MRRTTPEPITRPDGAALTVAAEGDRLTLVDGGDRIALYPRGSDLFWADDPRFATYLVAFGRDKAKHVVEFTYGSQWYPNERYTGPRTFAHPASWDALAGRYENVFFGQPEIARIVIVKDRLTFDGVDALEPRPDGTFRDWNVGRALRRLDGLATAASDDRRHPALSRGPPVEDFARTARAIAATSGKLEKIVFARRIFGNARRCRSCGRGAFFYR